MWSWCPAGRDPDSRRGDFDRRRGGGAVVNGALGAIEGAGDRRRERREARRQFVRGRSTHHRHDRCNRFGGGPIVAGSGGRSSFTNWGTAATNPHPKMPPIPTSPTPTSPGPTATRHPAVCKPGRTACKRLPAYRQKLTKLIKNLRIGTYYPICVGVNVAILSGSPPAAIAKEERRHVFTFFDIGRHPTADVPRP